MSCRGFSSFRIKKVRLSGTENRKERSEHGFKNFIKNDGASFSNYRSGSIRRTTRLSWSVLLATLTTCSLWLLSEDMLLKTESFMCDFIHRLTKANYDSWQCHGCIHLAPEKWILLTGCSFLVSGSAEKYPQSQPPKYYFNQTLTLNVCTCGWDPVGKQFTELRP